MRALYLAIFLCLPSVALALEQSGPITVTQDGQIIENLDIVALGQTAIVVNGYSNVVIRNVRISHDDSYGIDCAHSPGLTVEDVSITHVGASVDSAHENNINTYRCSDMRIDRVRLRGGSSGVYVLESPDAHLSFIEGYDQRGPMPRGQLVQFNKSPNCILEDFSAINGTDSWVADNVSVYRSENCKIRRGMLDGNNMPSGVGVMFEGVTAGLAEDVDTVRMGNGSFSAYPAHNIIFRRTRARENICTDQGRGLPGSGGLVWAGSTSSSGLRIEDSRYFNLCAPNNIVWNGRSFTLIDISSEDFTLRNPIVLTMPWEGEPAPDPVPDPTHEHDLQAHEHPHEHALPEHSHDEYVLEADLNVIVDTLLDIIDEHTHTHTHTVNPN